jgi:integrase
MRKKGSRNKGFWYRKDRGWYVGSAKLLDAEGHHIKGRDDKQAAEQAYHALKANGEQEVPTQDRHTVEYICLRYLKLAEKETPGQTYTLRKRLLMDFCTGKTASGKRIHKGYGSLPVADLIGNDIQEWFDAHSWTGTRRMAFQAIRRAILRCKKLGLVKENPIKGFVVDPAHARDAFFDDTTIAAIEATASPALADFVRALIATGARPGEVARLEKRHVEMDDGKMSWRFPPTEHKTGKKTGKDRVIPVNAAIADLVRGKTGKGPIFRNTKGGIWTPTGLKTAFARLRKQLAKKGIKLSKDQTMYAARHTFAQRQIAKGVSQNILAEQMGNSPDICWKHYGRLWASRKENQAALRTGID